MTLEKPNPQSKSSFSSDVDDVVSTTYSDIVAAASKFRGHVRPTPLLRFDELNELIEAEILLKAESLQRTGSFKFRGAYNKITNVASRHPRTSIVSWSSGNHAQAVAAAARISSLPATIVMPKDAPEIKILGTKRQGAEIVFYDRARESREAIGTEIARRKKAIVVPPYDDPLVIAGQGTVGLEAASQALNSDLIPDVALVPCGGGGLIAGCSIALQEQFPAIKIHPVEPIGFDDTTRSLATGRRSKISGNVVSICDALLAPTPGEITFRINLKRLSHGITVSDSDVLLAMNFAFQKLKLAIEPGGAVALAALLANKELYKNKTVLIVLSGGNVDSSIFASALSQ